MARRFILFFSAFLLLSGCAGVAPTLPSSVQPEPNASYVAGLFNRGSGINFALVLRSTDGKTEYVMPMGEDSALPSKIEHSSIAIKVIPGTYSITQWITYSTLNKEVMTRRPIDATQLLSKPFTVEAGTVTHLGNFAMESNPGYGGFNGAVHTIRFKIEMHLLRTTRQEVRDAFTQAYPNLASQAFECLFCSDSAQLASAAQR